ncbi:MAG: histidine phosphatase family protein [Clostridia bacterium]|nr:histidine phosphatase family protein [Clostridia bacterium]
MRVYVVRHGESETNRSRVWTGWTDAVLTDKGKDDAKRVGEFLKQISFEKIFTSDLSRAIETAKVAIPGCQYESSALLREINVGTLANKPLSILTDEQRANIAQNGYVEFDGETKKELQDRISLFIKKLELLDCQNVAVFTHNGWMRSVLDLLIGTTLPRKNICCNNCAVAIFEYTTTWKLHSWMNLL